MPNGRFTIRDLARVNLNIDLKKIGLVLPIKGLIHHPKGGDFTPEKIGKNPKRKDDNSNVVKKLYHSRCEDTTCKICNN